MNARTIAALALSAGLLAVSAPHAMAADGPLAHFAGNYTGNGKITVKDGTSERIRCRSTNTATGNGLNLSMRCASDSYKFDLGSELTASGNEISGSWNETTRGVNGSVSGRINGGTIQGTATAVGVTAGIAIHSSANSLSVSIRSPGSEVSEVSVSMAKGR
jgi:hypothetical protein